MTNYDHRGSLAHIVDLVSTQKKIWLITGVGGFIGSHLLEALLSAGQIVRGLDNFSTGHRANIDDVRSYVGEAAWANFEFVQGDIRDPNTCLDACRGVDVVLHQAALGSVGMSLADPLQSHGVNVTGMLNVLEACRKMDARIVYAASSAAYGDCEDVPAVESKIGAALSPYGLGKHINELYAGIYCRAFGVQAIGLRYFNVFGPRQDPAGPYAAVIPRWIDALLGGGPVYVNGDGKITRDFCYVDNIVQANLKSAITDKNVSGQIFNVAGGEETSLNELFALLSEVVGAIGTGSVSPPIHRSAQPGEVLRSLADIGKTISFLDYTPEIGMAEGLRRTVEWYAMRQR